MNSIVQKTWGYYEILKSGKKFLVKKLFVIFSVNSFVDIFRS